LDGNNNDTNHPDLDGNNNDTNHPDSEAELKLDDIKIEYHPSSSRPPEIFPFDEFKRYTESMYEPPPDQKPWKPFRSREDFEFAEIALDAAMNRAQIDAMIKLFHRCLNHMGSFTLQNNDDLKDVWDKALNILTPVSTSISD
jgi:hypothetical protein